MSDLPPTIWSPSHRGSKLMSLNWLWAIPWRKVSKPGVFWTCSTMFDHVQPAKITKIVVSDDVDVFWIPWTIYGKTWEHSPTKTAKIWGPSDTSVSRNNSRWFSQQPWCVSSFITCFPKVGNSQTQHELLRLSELVLDFRPMMKIGTDPPWISSTRP